VNQLRLRFERDVKAWAASVAAVAVSALAWYLLTAFVGAGMIAWGVYVLAGIGWALIVGGAFVLLVASFIRQGMTSG
jgi:hypothetical protein